MSKIGFVTLSVAGHANPSLTLANALSARGHEVIFYVLADGVKEIEQRGFPARSYGEDEFSPEAISRSWRELGELTGLRALRFTVDMLTRRAAVGLRDFSDLFRADQIDGLAVDQVVPAAGVVARADSIPFVTVSNALPFNMEPAIPPPSSHYGPSTGPIGKLRNRALNGLATRFMKPVFRLANHFQQERGLPSYKQPSEIRSNLAQVTQLPLAFDFPRKQLSNTFHYTGPFHNTNIRPSIEFPWNLVSNNLPLVYASMGTLQNRIRHVFDVISEACEPLPVQLVLSLGGSADPSEFPDLPGKQITVRYAPQLELLKRAAVCITHAGLNTALESLTQGVPMLAIPVANDQPGVAARIQWREVGRMIELRRLGVSEVRAMIEDLLSQPHYRENAKAMQREIEPIDGPALAAEIIEKATSTGKPVYREA